MSSEPLPQEKTHTKKLFKWILLTTLIAGTCDAVSAMVQFMIRTNGGNPLRVWRFVASGIFGKEAAAKNIWLMSGFGLLFHFFFAFCFTSFFFLVYPRIKFLSKNSILTGLGFGICVWLVMNLIVIPLSNTAKFPFNSTQAAIGMAIIMVAIGLPISLMAKRFYSSK